MLTEDRKRIAIFTRGIITNQTLQKSVKKISSNDGFKDGNFVFSSSNDIDGILMGIEGGSVPFNNGVRTQTSSSLWDGLNFPVKTQFKNRRRQNIYKKYLKLRRRFSKKKLPPSRFFELLKNNKGTLGDLDSHIDKISGEIANLKRSGQHDMREVFEAKLNILNAEKKLKESKFDQFLSEENLVKFVLKSCRGLKLDYILNFDRIIPEDVIKSKDKAEELAVFDNYVILHYDPESAKLLKSEVQAKEEKKDPILFGLIKGSPKFYYIDDWVDEKCDLTYSKIISSLGVDEKL